jgi:Phage tail assembly chaperone proteins, E, or 41 or 14
MVDLKEREPKTPSGFREVVDEVRKTEAPKAEAPKAEAKEPPPAPAEKEQASENVADPIGQLEFKLRHKPIPAHGDTVSELKLREPTAADIERVGNPCQFDFSAEVPQVKFDAKVMSAMISVLAGIPPSSVRALHPKDWNTIAWGIANFFLPDLVPIGSS